MEWRRLFGCEHEEAAAPPVPLPRPTRMLWLGSFLCTRGRIKGLRHLRFTVAGDQAEAVRTMRGELLKTWDSVRAEQCQLILRRAEDYRRSALMPALSSLVRNRCVFAPPSQWRTGPRLEDIVQAVAVG